MPIRGLLVLILVLSTQTASAQAFSPDYKDSYPKNPNIDILNYAFELKLSDRSDSLSGKATIDARFLSAGQSELRLDLVKQSEALGGKGSFRGAFRISKPHGGWKAIR